MLTLSSLEPLLAERLPIPPLILSGRVPPTNATITLDTSTSSPDLMLWPEFHNGVAAGLRVRNGNIKWADGRAGITRNWILYNRSSSLWTDSGGSTAMTQAMAENSHAGTHAAHVHTTPFTSSMLIGFTVQ
jgi:anaphase-promoting complex subunit 1